MEVVKPDFFNASILGFKKLCIVLTGRSIYFRILCKEWFHIQVDSEAQSTKKKNPSVQINIAQNHKYNFLKTPQTDQVVNKLSNAQSC